MTKTAATIEARMTSSRLPGKVLMEAAGLSFLEHMIQRLKMVPSLDDIIVATTVNASDDPVVALAKKIGVSYYRGNEDDVLDRVLMAAKSHNVDVIVETTGDCPLIDPQIVENCVQSYRAKNVDYLSNILERTYPIGMDTQVFATDILQDVANRTDDVQDHEHVSLFIYKHPEIYTLANIAAVQSQHDPSLRLTLDTQEDCDVLRNIFEALYPQKDNFTLGDILAYLRAHPEVREVNQHVQHRTV